MKVVGNMCMSSVEKNIVEDAYVKTLKYLVGDHAEPREGIVELLESLLLGNAVFFSAPPAYGKTMIPYTLANIVTERWDYFTRCYHVLPLRSIIDEAYSNLFMKDGSPRLAKLSNQVVGKQMMGQSLSPMLQKLLVLTTIDTFVLSACKIPPLEAPKIAWGVSLGHGIYTRSAMLSGVTVFDEIQLFVEEQGLLPTSFVGVAGWLLSEGSPTVIMSATFPDPVALFLKKRLEESSSIPLKMLRYGKDFTDKNFEEEHERASIKVRLSNVSDMHEIAKVIKDYAISNDKVLVVVNTIRRLKELTSKLEEYGLNPIVLHSKMISADKQKKLNKLRESSWLAVATQVVEAGVNISAQVLITDVGPPSPLIQRIGRLLRTKEDIEKEEIGEAIVVKPPEAEGGFGEIYDTSLVLHVIKELRAYENKPLPWHLPKTYEAFMERVYSEADFKVKINDARLLYLSKALFDDLKYADFTISLIEQIFGGSLTRDEPLITGIVDLRGISAQGPLEFDFFTKWLEECCLPLSLSDVLRLYDSEFAKEVSVAVRSEDKVNFVKISSLKRKELFEKLISYEVLSVVLPGQVYNEKIGLLI